MVTKTISTPEPYSQQSTASYAPAKEWALESLVQPYFFCGQLLNDQDLNQLLAWNEGKHRLNRYRLGWGVVCGLLVEADEQRRGWIRVHPGYAIDPNGNDIVVSKTLYHDLYDNLRDVFVASRQKAVVAADIYIHWDLRPAAPQSTLGRSTCSEVDNYEYSRRYEVANIHCQIVSTREQDTTDVKDWIGEYDKCLRVLDEYESFLAGGYFREIDRIKTESEHERERVKAKGEWFIRWLERHPVRQFTFVYDLIRSYQDLLDGHSPIDQDDEERRIVQILFWLIQDRRNAFLSAARSCLDGAQKPGVPLARVWVEHDRVSGIRICALDPYPPFRRPLHIDRWVAAPGEVNLAQFIWQRPQETALQLAGMGFHFDFEDRTDEFPQQVRQLRNYLQANLFGDPAASRYEPLAVQTIDTDQLLRQSSPEIADKLALGQRIIGFGASAQRRQYVRRAPAGDGGYEREETGGERTAAQDDTSAYAAEHDVQQGEASSSAPAADRQRQEYTAEPTRPTRQEHEPEPRQAYANQVEDVTAVDETPSSPPPAEADAESPVQTAQHDAAVPEYEVETLQQTAIEPVEEVQEVVEEEVAPATETLAATGEKLESVSGPEAGDDLTLIHGIGQKRAQMLAESGIFTFAQLVDWPSDALQEIAGVGESVVEDWKAQARGHLTG